MNSLMVLSFLQLEQMELAILSLGSAAEKQSATNRLQSYKVN